MNQSRWLLTAAVACAVAYTLTEAWRPYPLSYLLKALPALLLAAYCLRHLPHRDRSPWVIALLAAAVGDVFLDFGHHSHLHLGLAAFAITQFGLCWLFWRRPGRRPSWQWLGMPVGTVIFLWLLWPFFDWRAPLIGLYSLLLTAMVMGALRANLNPATQAGALLFLLSDSFIAFDTFYWHSQLGMSTIFISYFAALLLLVTGWVSAHRSETETECLPTGSTDAPVHR
ncbi:lysoplasmalogenase [Ferrimonas sp. SCSIO 43195]|uniref:lysoplasmalogenase n=1 Tax=Ferrimonas sp. SCSIO 43195 TaxID=2822844 RepID=UPI0020759EA5|nr:lysoplasmalogenase [Ferrimonas sp. SCSIO 43195]USD36411.1 lysoplasmalogenase [Ferrimonas sp. SCSIO 43195]